MMSSVNIIVAVAENNCICSTGMIDEDTHYFLDKVKGSAAILGRGTFEYMEEEGQLDDTTLYFILSKSGYENDEQNCIPCSSFLTALAHAKKTERSIWICGGESVYEEAISYCDRLYITRIYQSIEGEHVFPVNWRSYFNRIVAERWKMDDDHPMNYAFQVYEKK
ncbi:hypothetical protein PCE1_002024 [Barthelona sp. PCE]